MAKGERAFWSSLPGVLTGLAGILTASVALLGLALSQGWIGDGGGEDDSADVGGEVVRISVDPPSLKFRNIPFPGTSEEVAKVLNDGTAPVVLETEITGDDRTEFALDDEDCTSGPLPPGRTCAVTVRLNGSTDSSATLVISANDGELSREVTLEGTLL